MGELPSGRVTLLFTDVEGSTRLLQETGERYGEILDAYRRRLRAAFAAHRGIEVDTQGDAFFVAFASADDAVGAALDAQRALGQGPVRARMGIHTGQPTLREGGYVGMDVHRAARICAAGHGGQVLLTTATRSALTAAIPLRDLGEHRLKDLVAPEWLFQLGGAGLDERFPPLRSLNNTNLPASASALVGRGRELVELVALLERKDVRLVTLTGPGGIGKTRLAVAVAASLVERFRNGVFLVELASVREPAQVLATIARTVGAKESGTATPLDALRGHLETRSALLVLDSFEQVLDAAPEIAGVLEGAPSVKLLATSRERLRLRGEREYAVPALVTDDAIELFVERARTVRPDFDAAREQTYVQAICARLDGLPLAIELAAARIKLLAPSDMLARLERRLTVLTGGARDHPERHQTLRLTIDWSYHLLEPAEREAFAALSVFARDWSASAADDVCGVSLDALGSLLDKSLIRRSGRAAAVDRFAMLETIHEYAAECCEAAGRADALRLRHAAHYLRLASTVRAEREHLFQQAGNDDQPGTGAPLISEGPLLDVVDAEREEIVGALRTYVERGDAGAATEILLAAWRLWLMRGPMRDGREWTERVLRLPGVSKLADYGWLLSMAAEFPRFQGDLERACELLEAAIPYVRVDANGRRLVVTLGRLASVLAGRGDFARARALHEESLALARRSANRTLVSHALNGLTELAFREGDYARMAVAADEELAHARMTRDELYLVAANANAGAAHCRLGHPSLAASHYRDALDLCQTSGNSGDTAECVDGLADVAAALGDPTTAATLWAASGRMLEDGGYAPWDPSGRDDAIHGARRATPPEAFDLAWQRGLGLEPEQAVAMARAVAESATGLPPPAER